MHPDPVNPKRILHDGRDDGLEPLEPLDLGAVKSCSDLVRGMAKTAFGGRRLGEALDACERALATDAKNAMALLVRARVYSQRRDHAKARADCTRALALAPNWAWAHITHGSVLGRQGRHEDAIRALSRAVPMAPRDPELFALLGRSYLALHRYRSAIQNLDRAVALDARMAEELAQELEEVKKRRD